jgi:hypothetical protein
MRIRNTGTFTSFFKDKKSKKLQNSRNQGFLLLLDERRIRSRIREAQNNPADQDPQHCQKHFVIIYRISYTVYRYCYFLHWNIPEHLIITNLQSQVYPFFIVDCMLLVGCTFVCFMLFLYIYFCQEISAGLMSI